MTLANFSTRYGTVNNDTITGSNLQVVLGLAGDDRLTAGSASVLAGGLGNDTYVVRAGEAAAILESGGTDTVIFPFSIVASSGVILTFDNRHLGIGDRATNTVATILDWQNPANRVEKFEFVDGTVTYEQVVSQYTSSLSYRGNAAWQQTDSNADGYIPPATGLTPEKKELNKHLEAAAAILFKNTPPEKLQDFESLEIALRDQLTAHVHPTFGHFFLRGSTETSAGKKRTIQTCVGTLSVSEQQAKKLKIKPRKRLSPWIEKSCLLLSANVSYENAARDFEELTGIAIGHSTQQRLVRLSRPSGDKYCLFKGLKQSENHLNKQANNFSFIRSKFLNP